ncbi:MAG: hypothetical protein PHW10_02690 [Candidatus Peribacteraceae bacterium]|nr:hypothetical protein [Candidatus Peribacteraceae bacterium]
MAEAVTMAEKGERQKRNLPKYMRVIVPVNNYFSRCCPDECDGGKFFAPQDFPVVLSAHHEALSDHSRSTNGGKGTTGKCLAQETKSFVTM